MNEAQLESFDSATAGLIKKAHTCSTLPNIDELLPCRHIGEMWSRLSEHHGDRNWMNYYSCMHDDEKPQIFTFRQFGILIERVADLLHNDYGISSGSSVATLTINQPL